MFPRWTFFFSWLSAQGVDASFRPICPADFIASIVLPGGSLSAVQTPVRFVVQRTTRPRGGNRRGQAGGVRRRGGRGNEADGRSLHAAG